MYKIRYETRMKKDVKRMKRQGKDMSKLENVLDLLAAGPPLPPNYRDHLLIGGFRGFRECHIEPDWLLIYRIYEDTLILSATATGSHAYLFGM